MVSKKISVFAFTLIFGLSGSATMPISAQKLLNQLPEKKVTVDVVLKLGVVNSDQYRIISSEALTKDDGSAVIRGLLDSKLVASGGAFDDQLKRTGNTQLQGDLERIQGTRASLGYRKTLKTGTSISVDWGVTRNLTDVSGGSVTGRQNLNQTEFRSDIAIRQQLWRNALGRSIRDGLEAAEFRSESVLLNVQTQVDDFSFGLIETFYNTWLAQARVFANQARLARQDRLLKITRIQKSRGNAVEANVLQIRAARGFTAQGVADSELFLGDIWRSLVALLKLPEEFMNLDPKKIPLAIDRKFKEAVKLCRTNKNSFLAIQDSPHVKQARFLKDAADLQLRREKRESSPQLALELKMANNGVSGTVDWIDKSVDPLNTDVTAFRDPDSAADAFRHSLFGPHKQVTAGIFFEMPLGNIEAERSIAVASKAKVQADSQYSLVTNNQSVAWRNACLALTRSSRKVDAMIQIYRSQLKRSTMEERRFKLGRISAFEVINAGNDVSDAETAVAAARRDLRVNAWKVIQLKGGLKAHLDSIPNFKIQ